MNVVHGDLVVVPNQVSCLIIIILNEELNDQVYNEHNFEDLINDKEYRAPLWPSKGCLVSILKRGENANDSIDQRPNLIILIRNRDD